MYHGHEHLLFAMVIFFSVLVSFNVFKTWLPNFFHPDAFCASACAIFFYSGREFRDAEKLGYWDAPGFWWPVGGALVLYATATLISVHSHTKHGNTDRPVAAVDWNAGSKTYIRM